jgi:hypothetical protein
MRQSAMTIEYVALNMKISDNLYCPIIAKLNRTTCLVYNPEFIFWSLRRPLISRKGSSDDDALFHVSLLWYNQDLVARAERAYEAPAISSPR